MDPAKNSSGEDPLRDDAFLIPADDRATVERIAGQGAATYGEILPLGVGALIAALRPGPSDVFYDLGSGGGSMVLQVARESPVGRAIGVELSHARHKVACARLTQEAALSSRVAFIEGDLAKVAIPDATLVFAGSLCFPDPLMLALARVALEAPRLRRLATIRPLLGADRSRFSPVAELDLAATWSPRVRVKVYEPRRS